MDTPYQEGVFQLAINVPEQYPLVPPQVRFVTKIFHPNVHFKVLFLSCSCPDTCEMLCYAVHLNIRLTQIHANSIRNHKQLLLSLG